jgi:hypothetical protein
VSPAAEFPRGRAAEVLALVRKEVVILVAVLAGLVVIYLASERPFGGRGGAPVPTALFPETLSVPADSITIDGPHEHLTLVRTPDGWITRVDSRTEYVDGNKIRNALDLIAGLTAAEVASIVPGNQSVFEVGETSGTRVRVRGGGRTLADLIVGKRGPDYLTAYFRPHGVEEVYLSQRSLASTLLRSPEGWRDRTIMQFDENTATGLTIRQAESRIVLERSPEGEWTMAEPEQRSAVREVVDQSILTLSGLNASEFGDTLVPSECGLKPAAAVVSVELEGAGAESIMIGDRRTDGYYCVMRPDRPVIYLVAGSAIDRVLRPPSYYSAE